MSDLYGLLFRTILHPGWESGLRRRPTLAHLRQLRRSEWFALDELEALQTTALRRLLEDAQEARRMGERGRRKAESELTWDLVAARHREAYAMALARPT